MRKIVKIDTDLCNGCGACIIDCHEAALKLVHGKAVIVKESLCDGIGDCLGACPLGALTIEERQAADYNEDEVRRRLSKLSQWPLKIRLINPENPVFQRADLVIAADCAAFASEDFHMKYSASPVVIGCPKFDDVALYIERLRELFQKASLRSCTVARMSVPCCAGLARAVELAAEGTGMAVNIDIIPTGR